MFRKALPPGILLLALALAGCTASNLPGGARLVGGGLMIEDAAPTDGTAILIERTSGRVVATESVPEGDAFSFHPNQQGYAERLFRMFGGTHTVENSERVQVPANAVSQLYLVPATATRD
jgi:hypothetical protein